MESIHIIFENAYRHASFAARPYIRGIKYNGYIFGGGGSDRVYNFSDFWSMVSCYLYKGDTTINQSLFTSEEWAKIKGWADSYAAKHHDCTLTITND